MAEVAEYTSAGITEVTRAVATISHHVMRSGALASDDRPTRRTPNVIQAYSSTVAGTMNRNARKAARVRTGASAAWLSCAIVPCFIGKQTLGQSAMGTNTLVSSGNGH